MANVLQEQGHDPASRGADHAECDLTSDLRIELGDVRRNGAKLSQNTTRSLDDNDAGLGEGSSGASDEFGAELTLEPGNPVRDIGLDGPEGFGRVRKCAVVSDADQGL